jgi:hypothetical protein
VLILVAALAIGIWIWLAQRSSATFKVVDDPATGKITAQNDVIKVVWGYKPLPNERNNRSGGSIYGLWDKTRDPDCRHNLVQLIQWGSGYSTASHAGIGGFGATKAYIDNSSTAISENGLGGKLTSKDVHTDARGAVHVDVTFRVSAPTERVPRYEITKRWTVDSSGVVRLTATWRWLVHSLVDDPNYDFAVSRERGWTRVGWFTHGAQDCRGVGSDGWANPANRWYYDTKLATENDDDYGTMHVQKYTFDGSSLAAPLTIAIGVHRGGYESSGLFGIGAKTWASVSGVDPLMQVTGEFSNYRSAAFGHEVRWGAWYSDDGGSLTPPGAPTRYRSISASTTWSDDFTITFGR